MKIFQGLHFASSAFIDFKENPQHLTGVHSVHGKGTKFSAEVGGPDGLFLALLLNITEKEGTRGWTIYHRCCPTRLVFTIYNVTLRQVCGHMEKPGFYYIN
jgi:hypothetical protein